jgi:serine/threonine protein kinase
MIGVPNVVQLLDSFEGEEVWTQGHVFPKGERLVFEYASGGSLESLIKNRKKAFPQVLDDARIGRWVGADS